jgi:hypothetical protein
MASTGGCAPHLAAGVESGLAELEYVIHQAWSNICVLTR